MVKTKEISDIFFFPGSLEELGIEAFELVPVGNNPTGEVRVVEFTYSRDIASAIREAESELKQQIVELGGDGGVFKKEYIVDCTSRGDNWKNVYYVCSAVPVRKKKQSPKSNCF